MKTWKEVYAQSGLQAKEPRILVHSLHRSSRPIPREFCRRPRRRPLDREHRPCTGKSQISLQYSGGDRAHLLDWGRLTAIKLTQSEVAMSRCDAYLLFCYFCCWALLVGERNSCIVFARPTDTYASKHGRAKVAMGWGIKHK